MATKKFSPAQIAAQKLFAERARAGTLKQRKKRKPNPGLYDNINAKRARIAAGSGERMRKPGQAGRPTAQAFEQSAMTAKRNPGKSKPRAYVKRVSQATGAPPTKRLMNRRKMALKAPAGYFPNPKVKYTNRAKDLKGEQRIGYAVHMADRPSYQAIAWFTKKSDAVQVAQEASDRTGKQLAVTRIQNHFGPL